MTTTKRTKLVKSGSELRAVRTIEEPIPMSVSDLESVLLRNREYLLGQIALIQVDISDIDDQLEQIRAMKGQG